MNKIQLIKNLKFNYILNIKKKKLGFISTILSKIIKNFKNLNLTILNENFLYINKKNKKYYYKHTKYPGGIKKIEIKNLKKNLILKNCLKKMLKKKIDKKIIKKMNFYKKKNIKYKILNII